LKKDNTNIPGDESDKHIPDYMDWVKSLPNGELIRLVDNYSTLVATIQQQLVEACNLNASIPHRIEYAEHALHEIEEFYKESAFAHARKKVQKAFPFAYKDDGDAA